MFKGFLISCYLILFESGFISASAEQQQFKTSKDWACEESRLNKLALSEIQGGLAFNGLAHERQAIRLFSQKDAEALHGALGYLGDQIVCALAPTHPVEAEKLLLAAVERTMHVTGPRSIYTQVQLGDLFVFNVRQKNFSKALKVLNQTLAFNLSTGPTPSQSLNINQNVRSQVRPHTAVGVVHMILSAVKEVEATEPIFAISATSRVLKAQEIYLGENDERLVETLGALGDAYYQAKKYNEADCFYSRAYRVANEYHPNSAYAVRLCGQNFLPNLVEIGRSEFANQISKLE